MWLSRDPIAENGGLNLYAYVLNNPINYWDPDGLTPWSPYPGTGLTVSLGDSPALDKAGRIISKQDKMAKDIIDDSTKKIEVSERCLKM